eukprot:GILJ01002701.1.p1 GENE.GILJ01002701.1~~GILJ01002701.1.p1  ORF type:complete len:259 (+),score=31.60 GILJ01002701.1:53-778(+)
MAAILAEQRQELVFNARICEQLSRFEEMVEYVRRLAQLSVDLSSDERNLLAVAYKNIVAARRDAIKHLVNLEQKEIRSMKENQLSILRQYRGGIEQELNNLCLDALVLCDRYLLPCAAQAESKVFYMKMKGDYYRYSCEASIAGASDASERALFSYSTALELAQAQLHAANAVRLGLCLNFSVFCYHILHQKEKATELAKKAFDDALAVLDSIPEDAYRDATIVMQLIKDNLDQWEIQMVY